MKMLGLSTCLLLPLLIVASPAEASGSCFAASYLGTSASGTVSTSDREDWYYHNPGILGSTTYTLYPFAGDADLAVYDYNCNSQLCSSAYGGTTPDSCTATNSGLLNSQAQRVKVYYFSSSSGYVDYTIVATNALL